jgi:hypothetical protein
MDGQINNPLFDTKPQLVSVQQIKIYNNCFEYKREAHDVINEYIQSNWNTELCNFKNHYNQEADFMEQLSQHKLFVLVCMLGLNDDDYMEKCYEIQSLVN